MTNDPKADAEALAKLRAWQAKPREGFGRKFDMESWLAETLVMLTEFPVYPYIGPSVRTDWMEGDSLPTAVDAALEAWEKMERGQG